MIQSTHIIESADAALGHDRVQLAEQLLALLGHVAVGTDDSQRWTIVESDRTHATREKAIRAHVAGLVSLVRQPIAEGNGAAADSPEPPEPAAVTEPPEPAQSDVADNGAPEPRGGRIADYRRRAASYLRQHGPSRRSDVCRACYIPSGSMTIVFRDEQFAIGPGGLVSLADGQRDSRWREPRRKKSKARSAPRDTGQALATLTKLLKESQPRTLAELADETGLAQAELFKLLSNESKFEKTPAGYWVV